METWKWKRNETEDMNGVRMYKKRSRNSSTEEDSTTHRKRADPGTSGRSGVGVGFTSFQAGPSISASFDRSFRPLKAPANCTLVSALGPSVLQKAIKNFKSEKGLTREDYIQLDWVFGPLIQSAFEIIDKQSASEDNINPTPKPGTSATAARTPVNISNVLERPIAVFQCSKSRPLRVIVRVIGSKENYYWIRMTNDHFSTFTKPEVKLTASVLSPCSCQCVSYKWRKDICKHILAAYFYLGVTDKSEFVEIDEIEFDRICETACPQ